VKAPKKILITPLDWGLGHATRCVPIIKELMNRGSVVHIATSGGALILLRQEFPTLKFHELVSYRPYYTKRIPLAIGLIFQIPKFVKCIKKEHQQAEDIVSAEKIDFLISDNRYGCWSKQVPSVFITHQINLLMPWALGWVSPFINLINRQLISKYDYRWVPDFANNRITGKMTEPNKMKISYIGMLSRFEKIQAVDKKYDLLALISGPEPQRTMLEQRLCEKLRLTQLSVMLVRGIPEGSSSLNLPSNVSQLNHLSAGELNQVIQESEIVVSRPGYSTIMDLVRLGKKAIFIPTAGQTEQEYLAQELEKRKIAFSTSLTELDLDNAIRISAGYTGFMGEMKNHDLGSAIDDLLYETS
jgi:uncharacterized protein (TIGR00661 family)